MKFCRAPFLLFTAVAVAVPATTAASTAFPAVNDLPFRNVRIENCKLTSRTFGVYVKTRIGRAGVIENISGDGLDVLGGEFFSPAI